MGDTGDDFKMFREYKKEQKQSRGARNKQELTDSGLEHDSKDPLGVHYHVYLPDGSKASFWPTTGAWRAHAAGATTSYGWASFAKFAGEHGWIKPPKKGTS